MKKMLKCMPHAHAFVERQTDGSYELTSYATKAATLTADGWFTVHCWCSPTTRRHVAAFMDEYVYGLESQKQQANASTGSYQTCKALYEGNMRLDIHTGEVVECTESHILTIYTYDKSSDYYTDDHNIAMGHLLRNLSGITMIAEKGNLVQVVADEKAAIVLDDLYECDMLRIWKTKTIAQVERMLQ